MFIIVRHGNTFEAGEKPRRIGARTDLPLTAQGVLQASALGRFFAQEGVHFSRAFVSPLLRTRQTVKEILARQTSPPVPEPADFLREVDYGPDEGQTESDVLDRLGAETLAAWEQSAQIPPGWGVDPAERITAWRELFDGSEGAIGATLLVTSNGVARYALLADSALHAAAAKLPSLKLPTGGYGIITREKTGALRLETWGARP